MLLWFADLMNVTEEVTIHRPNVSTLLSSTFIRGDLNAVTETCDVYTYIRCKKITPLVTAFRSPLMKALDRIVETLGL